MNSRLRMGLVAAATTLLAAAPLSAIFDTWTWLLQSVIVVALVAGAAALTRSLRAPVWGQFLGMAAALLIALTFMFPSGGELLLLLPAPATFAHFGQLISGSVPDMQTYAIPVPDSDPLLFISALSVGIVMMVIDLLTVVLRRPALAGLPMLAIYSVPVAVHTGSMPPVPFVIGATGFLWLLVADNVDRVRRFGRRFTEDGRDVDIWEPSPLAATGRRLAVVGIAVAVLLPVAVPGMTGGLLDNLTGLGGQGDGRGGGGVGRVNLFASLSGQLRQSETRTLVKVTTNEQDPFYLRFGVADEIGEDGFGARNPSGSPVTRGLPDPGALSGPWVSHEQFRAEVEITSDFSMPLLPVYTEPTRVANLHSSWLYDPWLQVIFSHREQSKGKKYSFDYVRPRYTPEMLEKAPALPANHPTRQQFTTVPQVREVEELVARLTRDKRSDYQRVRAIYDYFSRSNGFTYSLRTEGGTNGQDIINFLTNKTGFCQQYAAAMAWLVRAAGVPARVAFGFTNGSRQTDNTYTLTNLNLHAWTEVYFNGIGWVPFDPTPAANVPGSVRSAWAPNTDAPDPVSPSAPTADAPDVAPTAGPQERDRRNEGFEGGVTDSHDPNAPRVATWPFWSLAAIIALLALLAVPALRRISLRRRRHTRAGAAAVTTTLAATPPGVVAVVAGDRDGQRTRDHIHSAWDELIDTLIDFRVRVDPSETPRATVERLMSEKLPTAAAIDAVRLLGNAEERARYARGPLPGDKLGEALRDVRQALIGGADRRTRMVAVLLPPSVLLRWRSWGGQATTRLLATVGRVGDTLLRWSPRRLFAGRFTR